MTLDWLSMINNDIAEAWLAWLLTYWLHSLLMCCTAIGLVYVQKAPPAVSQRIWQVALLAPVVTSLLAIADPLAQLSPSLSARLLTMEAPLVLNTPLAEALGALRTPSNAVRGVAPIDGFATWGDVGILAGCCVLAIWFGVATIRLLRLAVASGILIRSLHGRHTVNDSRLLRRLHQISTRAKLQRRVTLSTAPGIAGPFVIGPLEICLPQGALVSFSDAEVDAVFAHEVAHLERRDWLTFPVVAVFEAVACVQPLNLWLAARFRRDAELACDDRAVELTNDPQSLARALAHTAELALARRTPALVPSMAQPRGALLARVRRLLVDGVSATPTSPVRWSALAVLALVAALSPSLGVAARERQAASTMTQSANDTARGNVTSPPDAEQLELELDALRQEEFQIQSELAALDAESAAATQNTTQRRLELEQALRHTQQTQVWRQQRFEEFWHDWERQQRTPLAAEGN